MNEAGILNHSRWECNIMWCLRHRSLQTMPVSGDKADISSATPFDWGIPAVFSVVFLRGEHYAQGWTRGCRKFNPTTQLDKTGGHGNDSQRIRAHDFHIGLAVM